MNFATDKKVLYHTIKFNHTHSFFVVNLWEIVAIKIENCFVKWGGKNPRGKYFVWGGYNLVAQYLKYQKQEKMSDEKVLPKTFSLVFTPLAGYSNYLPAPDKGNLICESDYNYSVTPVFFCLFPLLGKINCFPFKMAVKVQGIIKVPLSGFIDNEYQLEKINTPQKEQKAKDLVFQGRKRDVQGISTPNPQYYKTYRFFYDYFYGNQQAGKADKK